MVGTRGEEQPRQRMAQQFARLAPGGAMAVDFTGTEQRVRLALTEQLHLTRTGDPCGDGGRRLARCRGDELTVPRRPHLELYVDAVGDPPRDAPALTPEPPGRPPAP